MVTMTVLETEYNELDQNCTMRNRSVYRFINFNHREMVEETIEFILLQ